MSKLVFIQIYFRIYPSPLFLSLSSCSLLNTFLPSYFLPSSLIPRRTSLSFLPPSLPSANFYWALLVGQSYPRVWETILATRIYVLLSFLVCVLKWTLNLSIWFSLKWLALLIWECGGGGRRGCMRWKGFQLGQPPLDLPSPPTPPPQEVSSCDMKMPFQWPSVDAQMFVTVA